MTTPEFPTRTLLSFDVSAPHDLAASLDLNLTLPQGFSTRARLRLTHALAMELEAVVDAELQRIANELDSPFSETQLLALGSDESAAVWRQGPDVVAELLRQNGVAEDKINAFLVEQSPATPPAPPPDSAPPQS